MDVQLQWHRFPTVVASKALDDSWCSGRRLRRAAHTDRCPLVNGRHGLTPIPTGTKTEDEHMAKNTIFLWYDKDAEAAARFYTQTFPDSAMGRIVRAPSDYPSGKKGDVLTVEFTVAGVHCVGLNGGPEFKHSEAFSFQIATDNQEETDRYWNAIVGNGGQESACGWCKDKWGVSWQITPRVLTEALAAGGEEARRAFQAMMPMKKIDVATIEAARRG
jgi:predicted 3-demethylubiquinone-9 3-methyltransferase (glyoxalase superfamily)